MKPLIGLTPIVDAARDSLWMLPGYMRGLAEAEGVGMVPGGWYFADRRQRCGTGAVR